MEKDGHGDGRHDGDPSPQLEHLKSAHHYHHGPL